MHGCWFYCRASRPTVGLQTNSQPDGRFWAAHQGGLRAAAAAAAAAPANHGGDRLQGVIHLTSSLRVAAPPVAGPTGLLISAAIWSRSLLQLTFPGKYQLWPLARLELKGSSANLTGPACHHLAGREGGRKRECLSTPPPSRGPPAHTPSRYDFFLITLPPPGHAR